MADGILMKSGSGGSLDPDIMTTSPEHVLAGKIFGGVGSDEPQTGTMPNNGSISKSLNGGEAYTIPAGYHNGSGKVTANNLSGQTSGTASAGHILAGQTAWVNGNRLTGSMPNRGNISQSLAVNGSYTIPAGYHAGGGRISQSIATQGAQTITPGTAAKTIAANRYLTGVQTIAGDGNLAAGNIKKGVTIFGITGTHSGFVTEQSELYNKGTVGNAGGFNGTFAQHSATPPIQNTNGSIVMDTGCMVLKATKHYSFLATSNPINLAGYHYINFDVLSEVVADACAYLSEQLLINYTEGLSWLTFKYNLNTRKTITIDVSKFQRSLFVHFGITSSSHYINIYRIWLS